MGHASKRSKIANYFYDFTSETMDFGKHKFFLNTWGRMTETSGFGFLGVLKQAASDKYQLKVYSFGSEEEENTHRAYYTKFQPGVVASVPSSVQQVTPNLIFSLNSQEKHLLCRSHYLSQPMKNETKFSL